ncbi:hypothetical protein [Absidia glauca]|jgi:hypothetical protein|uniref:Uncharacterized protein n=1 Tax=Absidia glauca TaxID=4829 RepID=A0A163JCE2_ABSGL|nr:hypothetical protein [Absidia glauca]
MIATLPPDAPWFKRILSRWPKKRPLTTLAAANEKYVRHAPPTCENLTAKEFAHLTGIDLLQYDDEPAYATLPVQHHSSHTVRSSRTTASYKKKPRIWDQDFWEQQQQHQQHQQPKRSSVFQKGRFQVSVGDCQDDEQVTTLHPPVLEWKRKRSQESSCTT